MAARVDKVDSKVDGPVKRLLDSDSSLDNLDLRSVFSRRSSALDFLSSALSFLRSALESSDWDIRAESASSCVASSAVVGIEIESEGEEEEYWSRNMKDIRYVRLIDNLIEK